MFKIMVGKKLRMRRSIAFPDPDEPGGLSNDFHENEIVEIHRINEDGSFEITAQIDNGYRNGLVQETNKYFLTSTFKIFRLLPNWQAAGEDTIHIIVMLGILAQRMIIEISNVVAATAVRFCKKSKRRM